MKILKVGRATEGLRKTGNLVNTDLYVNMEW